MLACVDLYSEVDDTLDHKKITRNGSFETFFFFFFESRKYIYFLKSF